MDDVERPDEAGSELRSPVRRSTGAGGASQDMSVILVIVIMTVKLSSMAAAVLRIDLSRSQCGN
ncbi:hypothetical protein [Amycolatopsis sp. NPDC059657]|uniref:hypothetical protein n=1 Tax=Amycolatopsis sp. NPDC059657 TaxID=3346899 RepID=UPI00366B5B26